jgi:uncharacterized caspase-like protein
VEATLIALDSATNRTLFSREISLKDSVFVWPPEFRRALSAAAMNAAAAIAQSSQVASIVSPPVSEPSRSDLLEAERRNQEEERRRMEGERLLEERKRLEAERRELEEQRQRLEASPPASSVPASPSPEEIRPPSPSSPSLPTLELPKGTDFGRYRALIIANQDYRILPQLRTPRADANALQDILAKEYGFSPVRVLINATRTAMVRALDELLRTSGANDNVLIYYAGHGHLDSDTDRGYWLPIDAEPDGRANWLSVTDVTDTIRGLKAKHVVVIADSCYSGTLQRERASGVERLSSPDLVRLAQKRARTVLSSGGIEPVLDRGGRGHSVFARAFIEALRSNNAAVVDLTRLFPDIRRRVMLNAEQTPEYRDIRQAGHDGGDFLFVRPR